MHWQIRPYDVRCSRFFLLGGDTTKAKFEVERAIHDAIAAVTRLVDLRDPFLKMRMFRKSSARMLDRGGPIIDVLDTALGMEDPTRIERRAQARSYLKEHPGQWTDRMEADLRRSIAKDPTFPKIRFR